jgi:hypothetical protein
MLIRQGPSNINGDWRPFMLSIAGYNLYLTISFNLTSRKEGDTVELNLCETVGDGLVTVIRAQRTQ